MVVVQWRIGELHWTLGSGCFCWAMARSSLADHIQWMFDWELLSYLCLVGCPLLGASEARVWMDQYYRSNFSPCVCVTDVSSSQEYFIQKRVDQYSLYFQSFLEKRQTMQIVWVKGCRLEFEKRVYLGWPYLSLFYTIRILTVTMGKLRTDPTRHHFLSFPVFKIVDESKSSITNYKTGGRQFELRLIS